MSGELTAMIAAGEKLVEAANAYMQERHRHDVETLGLNAGGYTITLTKGESWKDNDD